MALEIVDDGKQIYIIDRTQATEPVGKLRGHIDYNFDKAANELVLHTFEASPGGAGLGTLLMFELSQVALRGGVKIISVDSPALSAMAAYKVFGGVARNKGEHQELKSMYQEAIVANPGIHHNFIKYEAEAYAENEVAKESYFNPALSKEEREGRSINAKKAYADEKSGEGDYDRASDLKALSHQLIYIVGDLQSKAWSSLSAKWEIGDSEPAYQEEQSPKEEQGAKSSEKCFITTACMAARGLADDCMELAELRAFRDGFLRSRDEGPSLIAEYYRIAPRIVAAIDADPGSKAIYEDLYARLVCRSVELIQAGRRFEALENYRKIVLELESRI